MRFVAPERAAVDPIVFERPPLAQWLEFADLLRGSEWPSVATLGDWSAANRPPARPVLAPAPRFVVQSPELLRDGLHYEQRIAERGQIATRERNWHDLINALIWLRFPQLKSALNARQVAEISIAGPKVRTRAQCALTHFDEAGIVVLLRDPVLLAVWDAHDWYGLFWTNREAWTDGRAEVVVFGHALLEHALVPAQLLVGKALVAAMPQSGIVDNCETIDAIAAAIRGGELLDDPQGLRPLPLSGIPGWHPDNDAESFYREAPCFRPLRSGRRYPAPFSAASPGS